MVGGFELPTEEAVTVSGTDKPATDNPDEPARTGLSRRAMIGGLAGAAAITLAPTTLAAAAPGRTSHTRLTGTLERGAADWVYLPIDVPRGVSELHVAYSYDKPDVPAGDLGNSCDIGIFDQRGVALGGRGFRGWSGGARTEFSISAAEATPGYLPGRIDPGRWHIALGPYQVAPQGLTYAVEVTLSFGRPGRTPRPTYPPTSIAGRGTGWYRGDSHLHTVYSDGKRTPAQVVAAARAAGLDFIMTSDHNTTSSHPAWAPLAGDDLLIVIGEEVTTRNGHWLAWGTRPGEFIDWRYRSVDGDYDEFVRLVHRSGGLVVPAHPYCPYVGCRFKFGYAGADAIEVWNGPWTLDDEIAVQTWDNLLVQSGRHGGPWIPAMGNSDAHSFDQVVGLPQTVVHARDLSVHGLRRGIARGRSWLAESSSVDVSMTASAHGQRAGIGERLRTRHEQSQVDVEVRVAGVPDAVVRLYNDEGQALEASIGADGSGTVTWSTTSSLSPYVRAEVRHPSSDDPGTTGPNPMAAMTNPIWLSADRHR